MLTAHALHLLTLPDRYGAPLAEYYYAAEDSLLYVRWHGQLTAAEVIRGLQQGAQWRGQLSFQRILNDKLDSGGDWSDALPWLQYEWLPQAVAVGVRAMAYVLSDDLEGRIVSGEFVEAAQEHLNVALFSDLNSAQRWLLTQ